MLAEVQLLFRQCFCRAPGCGRMFLICSHCDRGQVYCSPDCRDLARRLQLRAANLRHQRSEEGRLDHCDRQRAYRLRLARSTNTSTAKSVTDHGSNDHSPHDIVDTAPTDDSELVAFGANLIQPLSPQSDFRLDRRAIACCCCGRTGLFIDPFHDLE
jgi:hypothetical protein